MCQENRGSQALDYQWPHPSPLTTVFGTPLSRGWRLEGEAWRRSSASDHDASQYVSTSISVYCPQRGITPMATSKKRSVRTVPKKRVGATEPEQEKPVALTLKVDGKTFVRLCTLGGTQRRTKQDLLQQALREFLDRAGAQCSFVHGWSESTTADFSRYGGIQCRQPPVMRMFLRLKRR